MLSGSAIDTPLIHSPYTINRELFKPHTHKILATAAVLSYLFASCSAIFSPNSSASGLSLYITACAFGVIASMVIISSPERKSEELTNKCRELTVRSVTPPLSQHNGDARRFLAFTNFANHAILYVGHSLMQRELAWFESTLFALSVVSNLILTLPNKNELGYAGYGLCTASVSTVLFALNATENNFPSNILACANFVTIAGSLMAMVLNLPSCSALSRSYDQVARSSANTGGMYV